ncbi:hypothetical protein GGI09_003418 [Coemansia sp. S100]|nr:hypothetical protein GGI09_003418 [Coemansia sp. S100]
MTDLSKCQVLHMENGVLVHDPKEFVNAKLHNYSTASKHAIQQFRKYMTGGKVYIVGEERVEDFEHNNLWDVDDRIEKHSYFVFMSNAKYDNMVEEHNTPRKLYNHISSLVNCV